MTEIQTRPFFRISQAFAFAALCSITALTTGAYAQSTDDTATEAEAEAEAPPETDDTESSVADLAAEVLSTGEPVPTPGQGPTVFLREEHGDWEVRCLEAPEGQEDPCYMFQRMLDQQGNPTAEINLFDLPDGGEIVAGATIQTPLQTLLTAQITISIDGGQARRYPYSFCDAAGCYSQIGLTAEDINQFRRGANATVIVVPAPAPDQPAQLTMSLTGFTAGYDAVKVANPE